MHPHDGRVVSNFILQALLGRPITVYGNGSQTRSFCYVDDMIDGIVRLMETPDDVTGPINLGSTTEATIRELAQLIIELTGSKSQIRYERLPSDDPHQRRADIRLAREILDWEPMVPIEKGLQITIEYFDDLLTSGRYKPAD